jgi:hypothetical protein
VKLAGLLPTVDTVLDSGCTTNASSCTVEYASGQVPVINSPDLFKKIPMRYFAGYAEMHLASLV